MAGFKMERMEVTRLRDVLFNMHESSGATDEYRKGIIVGVVSALMVCGLDYKAAIHRCVLQMPDTGSRISPKSVPECWFTDIGKEMTAHGKTWVCPV